MGYDFHVPAVRVSTSRETLQIELQLENRGVAPFYYDWPAEYGLIANGIVIKTVRSTGKLTGLLTDSPARLWKDTLNLTDVPPGTYILAVRVPNPLPNGPPIRFANETQDQHVAGWLSLSKFEH